MRRKLQGEITSEFFADMPIGTRGAVDHDHQEYWRFTFLKKERRSFGNVRSFPVPVTRTIHAVHFKLVQAA